MFLESFMVFSSWLSMVVIVGLGPHLLCTRMISVIHNRVYVMSRTDLLFTFAVVQMMINGLPF